MNSIVELQSADSSAAARIAPQFGFNCFEFVARVEGQTVSVLDAEPGFPATDSRPSGHGVPLLFPFPNRIRDGQYSWRGEIYELPPDRVPYDRTGNAIHGFCLDRPWRVIDQSRDSVTGEFQLSVDAPDRREFWPADFVIRATYSLQASRLNLEVEIENPDDVDLPWGFGTHAYFKLPLGTSSSPEACLMEAPVTRHWELSDCLPSGKTAEIPGAMDFDEGWRFGSSPLDDVFQLKADRSPADRRTLIIDERAGLQLEQRFSSEFEHLVVFTPPNRNAICLEPYTCMTDAINHPGEYGLRILPPGQKTKLFVVCEVSPVIA
ncbi:MAG TPA: aldose 1-epimerase [Planctomycetaceae bacterium]|nr:aldose 1-epimerase [Planctomycetaceae bacterium]